MKTEYEPVQAQIKPLHNVMRVRFHLQKQR